MRKRTLAAAKERKERGLKPYLVVLNEGGEVDGASIGKTFWESALRQYIPKIMDISCINYMKQDPDSSRQLRIALEDEFEFIDNTLDDEGYNKCVGNWLIKERARLKEIYMKEKIENKKRKEEIACPTHIENWQWENLKDYWDKPSTEEKAQDMRYARSRVKNVNRTGRRGYAGQAADLVSNSFSI